jgi:hypothetical protein
MSYGAGRDLREQINPRMIMLNYAKLRIVPD